MQEKELCERYMGKFPVISISLKSVDGLKYDSAVAALRTVIGNEAGRFRFLRDSAKLDEDDVPLDKAFQKGYYDEMISLIRSLFDNAVKTNDSLYFAVLTGCLRISKESIFTGLNNLKVHTISDVR